MFADIPRVVSTCNSKRDLLLSDLDFSGGSFVVASTAVTAASMDAQGASTGENG